MKKTDIMSQAWSLYRQTVTEYPETRSRAQFAICLKEAHRAARAAQTARCEWDALTGEEKYSALIRMTWTMKHRAEAQGRTRVAQMNQDVLSNLESIITALEHPEENDES